ncbi:CYTH domain-containing protein [Altibacter sp.]|uniref:CYTH domain-containing protein n=1 Tax=Altibacter sp. TaxID=2024823 RepID=UPI002587EDA3|nr:CYTH domain-containing protein [Altibacter sp.]MCW9036812.1 CYTH domain-containing protein [Altibacter sp.]
MVEIERKFLVTSEAYKKEAFRKERIVQGFLNTHPDRTVRVRIQGPLAFLTVKGRSNAAGTIRSEWETEISLPDAQHLLTLCEPSIIEKNRFEVNVGPHIFEVDEFLGANEGLSIAEIELESEDETFARPDWLGAEVSGKIQYYNSQLSLKPFKFWK